MEQDPTDLLRGASFRSATGLRGVIESDVFAWPTEVGGGPLIRALARRIARFDWHGPLSDIASILYETVIPPDDLLSSNGERDIIDRGDPVELLAEMLGCKKVVGTVHGDRIGRGFTGCQSRG